ncbi:hypothetical protein ABTP21_00005 [Acinetobacter baumannii]
MIGLNKPYRLGLCNKTQYNYKPFTYNLGQGLVWPAVMFPTVGKIIGGILILLFIWFVVIRPKL